MHAQVSRFDSFAAVNPAVVMSALEEEFSLKSLTRLGDRQGCQVEPDEIDRQLSKLVAGSKVVVSYKTHDGEIGMLTLDEAQLAAGGAAYVVAVAAVVAAVGVAVVASVGIGVYTWAGVYAQVALWG